MYGSIGSAKVLLENNRVSNHKRDAQGNIEGCEPIIIDAEKLVDLRFDSRVCMLPRQLLDLVPCKANGGVVQRKREARTRLRYQAPEIVTKQVCIPWASIQGSLELSTEER